MERSLDELVESFIELGEKDPHEAARRLIRHVGSERVLEVAKPYLEDFIAEMFRRRIGSKRRAAVARLTPAAIESREILLKSIWIPTEDGAFKYIAVGECAAADFDARADYVDRLIEGVVRHNRWNRAMAAQIRAEGVETAAELSEMPQLEAVEMDALSR